MYYNEAYRGIPSARTAPLDPDQVVAHSVTQGLQAALFAYGIKLLPCHSCCIHCWHHGKRDEMRGMRWLPQLTSTREYSVLVHLDVLPKCKTHWTMEDVSLIKKCNIQNRWVDWYLVHFLWYCPHGNATEPHWLYVNIGSGNGLVPSGDKPLSESILTRISLTWHH